MGLYIAGKTKMPSIITILLTFGLFGIFYFLFDITIIESNKSTIYTLIGAYTTAYLNCINYWFGTTFSSGAKDSMIYNSKPIEDKGDK